MGSSSAKRSHFSCLWLSTDRSYGCMSKPMLASSFLRPHPLTFVRHFKAPTLAFWSFPPQIPTLFIPWLFSLSHISSHLYHSLLLSCFPSPHHDQSTFSLCIYIFLLPNNKTTFPVIMDWPFWQFLYYAPSRTGRAINFLWLLECKQRTHKSWCKTIDSFPLHPSLGTLSIQLPSILLFSILRT